MYRGGNQSFGVKLICPYLVKGFIAKRKLRYRYFNAQCFKQDVGTLSIEPTIFIIIPLIGGPHSVMARTYDSQAGGLGFKSRCRPTKFGARPLPHPRLQVAIMCQGSLSPERSHVGWYTQKAEHPRRHQINSYDLSCGPHSCLDPCPSIIYVFLCAALQKQKEGFFSVARDYPQNKEKRAYVRRI